MDCIRINESVIGELLPILFRLIDGHVIVNHVILETIGRGAAFRGRLAVVCLAQGTSLGLWPFNSVELLQSNLLAIIIKYDLFRFYLLREIQSQGNFLSWVLF